MYIPEAFSVSEREPVLDLIDAYPFATVVTVVAGPDPDADVDAQGDRREGAEPPRLLVSHVPVTLCRDASGWGTLLGHVARGNPHWQHFDGECESLVIFQGPHAYVSPRWYAEPAAPPTWNYAVVHAYGKPRRIEDPARTAALLEELVARFESSPSELALSGDRRRALQKGIVAFELEIERVEPKFKLGQNKTAVDRAGTVAVLEGGGDEERALAFWTRRITGS
jgi:transcriptional regulator